MSFLIDRKLDHERKCEEAIRRDAFRDASFHAAKAAEFAFALARQSDGTISERYAEDAEGWLDLAERLKNKPAAKGKDQSSSTRRTTDQDDGDALSPENAWLVTEKPNVTFDMIAGMTDAKKAIREMVVYPLQAPEKAKLLKLPLGGGVLLYGPPGNGKTTLARAAANELDASFFYASGAEIRSKWHGESEQRLRSLMQAAKAEPVAILFLDDLDGLLPRRSGKSVVDNRIVVQFLNEIGGFESNDNMLLILGATNTPWDIDEAVFRTGRFDEKIYIALPDREARLGILQMHLDGVPVGDDINPEQWTDRLEGHTGSDIVGIVNAAKRSCHARSVKNDTDPMIELADMEGARRNIPSSATPALLKRYEAFRTARFA
ncbi:MAG: ATP-binding protein [Lentisphaerae bacterium]|jgi:transitional endoplasmic reticulum ATPase|nr:ATP-binding protein [Lentisphaerota bacterium]MBT7062047.1 ATP-binding protein [Lentisphaerota bacterium]